MRRVLVLGGTAWLGSRVAAAWVAAGADVTCAARGTSGGVPAGARLVRVDRTVPGALADLAGPWDEVVELAWEPALVAAGLVLADDAAHWTLVSSVSVYADHATPGADESAALVEPSDLADYAHAKVAAERATSARLGGRLLVVRPGLIAGPGDPSDRLGYWPGRLARGGDVLVPDHGHAQAVDVDELARWIAAAGAARRTGVVDAVGPSVPLTELLAVAARVTGFDGRLVPVPDDRLTALGVRPWAGPRSLPLWLPPEMGGMLRRSGAAYREAGGATTSWEDLLTCVLADERTRGLDRPRRTGMAPDEERAVLAAL